MHRYFGDGVERIASFASAGRALPFLARLAAGVFVSSGGRSFADGAAMDGIVGAGTRHD
jgi:hypothetical protein